MLKDITFGQYISGDSLIHRLDPRGKLCLFVAMIVLTFVASDVLSVLLVGVGILALVAFSKIPLVKYLKNLKSILIIILFTSVLNVFYVKTGTVILDYWIITITLDGVLRALLMSLRLVYLITLSSLLTYTSTPTSLTDGMERLFSPLKYIGLGGVVHSMAMMISIALRFIPTLLEETNKIISAQKARGADLESGGLMKRVKALLPILIPLLISAVRRASELAEAMECRCYNGGEGRVPMKQLRFANRDYVAVAVVCLFGAMIIAIKIFF